MPDYNSHSGGFLPPSLPSPSPSTSSSSPTSNLPHPRSNPLRPGSAKEDAARRYVEGRLLVVSRRYAKKYQPMEAGDDVKGYEGFGEVSRDLGDVVDVVWLSGTPNLQIPYLLNIALAITSYISAFPFSPKATFALLRKLDHAFSSLLKGEDSVTGETLPGFQGGVGKGLSKTDMVRCKGLVEATRALVFEVMGREGEVETEIETETEGEESGMETDRCSLQEEVIEGNLNWQMEVARVYEMTMMQLGEVLGQGEAFTVDKVETGAAAQESSGL
ncbi:hypothetical protein BUE80_DR013154, partial [Diplocarpon rosae]